jgi:hypothetical protein
MRHGQRDDHRRILRAPGRVDAGGRDRRTLLQAVEVTRTARLAKVTVSVICSGSVAAIRPMSPSKTALSSLTTRCSTLSPDWSPDERLQGKTIKVKGFPRDHQLRLGRVEVSTHRTDWVVTSALARDST